MIKNTIPLFGLNRCDFPFACQAALTLVAKYKSNEHFNAAAGLPNYQDANYFQTKADQLYNLILL